MISLRSGLLAARACLLVLMTASIGVLIPVAAAKIDSQAAQQALDEARALRAQIVQSHNPTKEQYLLCIQTYRRVYANDPTFGGCDDAIWEAGMLYQQMGDRFASPQYYREAVRFFRFLVSDYGASHFCPDALLRIGDLCAGPLQDKTGAEAAYRQLRSQYPHSKAIALVASRREPAPAEATARPQPKAQPEAPEEKAKQGQSSLVLASSGAVSHQSDSPTATLESIRHWTTAEYTRVIIDLNREAQYEKSMLAQPNRIYFDISNAHATKEFQGRLLVVGDDFLKQIRVAQNRSDVVRVVLDLESIDHYTVSELHNPFRIVVDLRGKRNAGYSVARVPESKPKPDEMNVSKFQVTEKRPTAPLAGPPQNPSAARSQQPLMARNEPVATAAKGSEAKPRNEETKPISGVEGSKPSIPPVNSTEAVKAGGAAKDSQPFPQKGPELRNRPAETADAPKPTEILHPSKSVEPKPSAAVPAETSPPIANSPSVIERKITPPDTGGRPPAPSPVDIPKPAPPTSRGDRTLTRMLGLKINRIVIDPGHGGHDTGTIGPGGLMEKDLVLEIARELKNLLEQKLNAQVLLTREADVFVPLEERTAIANQHQADLFVSIHANSSSTKSISGVETYYLDFARTAAEREVAARENAATTQNVRDLEELIKEIIQADKSRESRELASILQGKLFSDSQHLFPMTRNRGVRRAPFVVLIGANMPSVLTEVAFISNPRDEKLLKKQEVREHLAQAIFAGIERYAKALGSFVAQDHQK